MPAIPLRTLELLVLDCQASGATPAYGDLLELGWAVGSAADGDRVPARAHWIRPHTERPVPGPVRKLTGWSEACIAESRDAAEVWQELLVDANAAAGAPPALAAIHFARFELTFLRELHGRIVPATPFPLDVVCLHAMAARLFPDLPRIGLRALAGHLGHSADQRRASLGHVAASLFIWRALLPRLAALGIETWDELQAWLDIPVPSGRGTKNGKRIYPLPAERRKALPDSPGVYRYVRPNGDILYVGKAASLKKRVASYFTARTSGERLLEMLSQAHDVEITQCASPLEAALLETDEIKRLDPPYNIQLRKGERSAWFASRDWSTTRAIPDTEHRVGPLPSANALAGIAALRALVSGAAPSAELRADAVGVPSAFAPPEALFDAVWPSFVAAHLEGEGPLSARLLRASSRIVVSEKALVDDDAPPPGWDEATVQRHLERVLVAEGLLVRRARLLVLLCDAQVTFREPGASSPARRLVIAAGELVEQGAAADGLPPRSASTTPLTRRLAAFDAVRYDRLRVLATELQRIGARGGSVSVQVGRHRVRTQQPRSWEDVGEQSGAQHRSPKAKPRSTGRSGVLEGQQCSPRTRRGSREA